MKTVHITVTLDECVLVYMGTNPDGSANWRAFDRSFKRGVPFPKRLRKTKRKTS